MKGATSTQSTRELSLLVVGSSPLAAALTEALSEAGQDVEGATFEHAAAAATAVAPDMVIVCGEGKVKDDRKVLSAVSESGCWSTWPEDGLACPLGHRCRSAIYIEATTLVMVRRVHRGRSWPTCGCADRSGAA